MSQSESEEEEYPSSSSEEYSGWKKNAVSAKTWEDAEDVWLETYGPSIQNRVLLAQLDKEELEEGEDKELEDGAEDPLGIAMGHTTRLQYAGITGAGRRVRGTRHAQRKKKTASKMEGSVYATREDFSPELYLSEVHKLTGFEGLQEGRERLKQAVGTREAQLKALVKAHFDQFLSCKDTIDQVSRQLKDHEFGQTHVSGSTPVVKETFDVLIEQAVAVFDPIFVEQRKGQQMKKVLGALNNFRFLFSVSSRIKESIVQGEYDKVAYEYRRVRGVRQHVNANVLVQVVDDVENTVAEFRRALLIKLLDHPLQPLEHHHRMLRILTDLGMEEDPAWILLKRQGSCIGDTLEYAGKTIQQNLGDDTTGTIPDVVVEDHGEESVDGAAPRRRRLSETSDSRRSAFRLSGVQPSIMERPITLSRMALEQLPQQHARTPSLDMMTSPRQEDMYVGKLDIMCMNSGPPELKLTGDANARARAISTASKTLLEGIPIMWELARFLFPSHPQKETHDHIHPQRKDTRLRKARLKEFHGMIAKLMVDYVQHLQNVFSGSAAGEDVCVTESQDSNSKTNFVDAWKVYTMFREQQITSSLSKELLAALEKERKRMIEITRARLCHDLRKGCTLEDWALITTGLYQEDIGARPATRLPFLMAERVKEALQELDGIVVKGSAHVNMVFDIVMQGVQSFADTLYLSVFGVNPDMGLCACMEDDPALELLGEQSSSDALLITLRNARHVRLEYLDSVHKEMEQVFGRMEAECESSKIARETLVHLEGLILDRWVLNWSMAVQSLVHKGTQETQRESVEVSPFVLDILVLFMKAHYAVQQKEPVAVHQVLSRMTEALSISFWDAVLDMDSVISGQVHTMQWLLNVKFLRKILRHFATDISTAVWDKVELLIIGQSPPKNLHARLSQHVEAMSTKTHFMFRCLE